MGIKHSRKAIQRGIVFLAGRTEVPQATVQHELELIQQTTTACLERFADNSHEPGDCERCGRVLGECDGTVCDACRDRDEVAA